MRNKKLIVFAVFILFVLFRFSVLFNTPSQLGPTKIDPNQLGYFGLIQNHIIQLLFCLSLIIMLSGINYVRQLSSERKSGPLNLNVIFFAMILGLVGITVGILWINWTYINSSFAELTNMLIYEAYNPQSAPNMSYYQWKYSLNPAKVTLALLVIPILIPIFYYLIKLKKR